MRLTLKVRSYCGQPTADARVRSFDSFPIIIGRSTSSDYFLDDESRYISSNHAVVVVENNGLSIQDTSANGVYLNGSAEPIGHGRSQNLSDNDSITIGDYTIGIHIDLVNQNQSNESSSDPFDAFSPDFDPDAPTRAAGVIHNSGPSHDWTPPSASGGAAQDDPFDDLWSESEPKASPGTNNPKKTGSDWADWSGDDEQSSQSAAHAHQQDTPARSAEPFPEPRVNRQAAQPPPQQHQTAAASSDVNALGTILGAAGMNPADFTGVDQQVLAQQIGRLLASSVDALVILLHTRAELKNAVRTDVTSLSRVDNNPLKFAISSNDALNKLLLPKNQRGYLDADRAIHEAVDDLKAHQIAMLDGMKAAMKATLIRFNPSVLAKKLEATGSLSASIPITREAKLWELFTEQYASINDEALNDFNDFFGKEFRIAYEQRIRELGRSPEF